MEISDLYLPLEELKKQLKDYSPEEMEEYIETLSIARKQGPKKVKRSKDTGAPKKGSSQSPLNRADSALKELPLEEREALLKEISEKMD